MKYDRETFSMKEKVYKPKEKIEKEKESLTRKEKEYRKVNCLEKCVLNAPQKVVDQKVFDRSHTFEWDLFQWADYEFVQWANQQPATMVMAIMAELKRSPRMKPSIELLRSKVESIPLCSIELYSKKKKLGQRSVAFLTQMKKRYGNSVLRILYATFDS
jgi:hypothetical protein